MDLTSPSFLFNIKVMFLPYGHQSISEEDIKAVGEALRAPFITRGPQVKAFEEAIAKYVEAEFAVAFSSGTAALYAAYGVLDVGPADRVLTSPNTFIATCSYATEKGATAVFLDIDRSSGNMDFQWIEPNLEFRSLRGRLIIAPVHFAGIALDMEKLSSLIKALNVHVIEDSAHALGSYYPDGKKVGSCAYSDMTIFSFHPVKHITTGEGGMVTTNDPELYRKLLLFRNSGKETDPKYLQSPSSPWYYEVQKISGNYHLTEFQAALGLSQLKRLDQFIEKRRSLVKRYRERLKDVLRIRLFDPIYDEKTAYHLMVVQIDFEAHNTTRTQVMEELKKREIGSQYHYIPLYRFPCYKNVMGDLKEFFPEMEAYYQQALTLPLFPDMSFNDVDRVCNALKEVLQTPKQLAIS